MAARRCEPAASTAWLVGGWVLWAGRAAVEAAARWSSFQAGPALTAFDLGATAVAAVMVGTVVAWSTSGARRSSVAAPTAAAALGVAAVALQARASTINPAGRLPATLGVAGLVVLSLALWQRSDDLRCRGLVGAATRTIAASLFGAGAVLAWVPGPAGLPDHRHTAAAAAVAVATALTVIDVATTMVQRPRDDRRRRAVWGAVAVGLGVAAVVAHLTVPGRLWLSALAGAAALAVGLPPAVLDHCTRATERWAQRVLVALRVGLTAGVRTAASAAGRAVDVLGGHLAPRGPDGGPRRAATLRRSDVPWAVLVAAVSCGAVTYQVVWAWRAGVQPIGHSATVAARAWDVGTSNHPWLGMPTTFSDPIRGTEASHPGPLLFDLLAPFVRVFGLRAGAFIGCAVINLACWLVGTWAALRAGGRSAALLAWVAGGIVLHVLLRGAVYEAANALPTWLAILTCLLLCWAAVSGTPTALVGAVLLASLTSQAYLAHALVTVLPTAWAFGVVLRDRLRRHRPASDARALLGAVAVAVLCWAQPAAEALSNGGGNVVALWYGVSSDRPSLGWSGLWRAVAWTLGVPPPFGRLDRVFAPDWRHYLGGLAPWGLVVAAAVAVAWGARRQRALTAERRLWVLAVLTVAAAGVSLVALPVAMTAFYQLVWLGVVSVFAWFAIAESARRAVLDRWKVGAALAPRLRVAGVVVVAAAVTWFSTSAPDGVLDLKGPYGVTDLATPALVDAALTATADGDPTLVLGMDRLTEQSAADVVTANLIAEGRDVLVEPYVGTYYGPDRVVEEGWSGRSLLLVDGAAPRNPDGRRLARFEPPGWSPERFRRTAEQVRTWAVEHGPLTVDPTLVPRLLPYADGWMADLDCGRARRLEQGAIDASQLPAGVVVALYADAAVSTPRLPGRLRRAVERDAIATPVELWAAELDVPPGRSLQSADLLRSGRLCDRPDPDRAGR